MLLVCGCSNVSKNAHSTITRPKPQTLSGAYKTAATMKSENDRTARPVYWYFKKNGKLYHYSPQVRSTTNPQQIWYAQADEGTWKSLGNNKFKLKINDYHSSQYHNKRIFYTYKVKRSGNQLHTYYDSYSYNEQTVWLSKESVKQPAVTFVKYMTEFQKARLFVEKDTEIDKLTDAGQVPDPGAYATAGPYSVDDDQ